jgi:hypothetical protein
MTMRTGHDVRAFMLSERPPIAPGVTAGRRIVIGSGKERRSLTKHVALFPEAIVPWS